MYKLWLSFALGVGLLACGTPDTPRDNQKPTKGDTSPDGDDDDDPRGAPLDAGKKDAGKADAGKADAGKPDAGGARTQDAGPSVVMRDSGAPLTPVGGGGLIPDPTRNGEEPQNGDNPAANPGNGNTGTDNMPPPAVTPAAGGGGLGGGCSTDADCGGGGLTCFTTVSDPAVPGASVTFPGGYCTKGCKQDSDCGPGAGCPFGPFLGIPAIADLVGKYSQCAKQCSAATDCRSGYSCKVLRAGGSDLGTATHCQPPNPFEETLPPGIL